MWVFIAARDLGVVKVCACSFVICGLPVDCCDSFAVGLQMLLITYLLVSGIFCYLAFPVFGFPVFGILVFWAAGSV